MDRSKEVRKYCQKMCNPNRINHTNKVAILFFLNKKPVCCHFKKSHFILIYRLAIYFHNISQYFRMNLNNHIPNSITVLSLEVKNIMFETSPQISGSLLHSMYTRLQKMREPWWFRSLFFFLRILN